MNRIERMRKLAADTAKRVANHRKKKLLRQIKLDGWSSLKELQDEVREVGVPWTWNSRRKPQPGQENVTIDDLLPSRKVVSTLRKRRPSGGRTDGKKP